MNIKLKLKEEMKENELIKSIIKERGLKNVIIGKIELNLNIYGTDVIINYFNNELEKELKIYHTEVKTIDYNFMEIIKKINEKLKFDNDKIYNQKDFIDLYYQLMEVKFIIDKIIEEVKKYYKEKYNFEFKD